MYVLHSTTYVCNMKRHSIAAELMKNSYIIVVIQRGAEMLTRGGGVSLVQRGVR